MGLDMYLTKKVYVQNWSHQPKEERHTISVKKGGKKRIDINTKKVSYVIEEVGYWRKANAIHQWFVDNCQKGVDDCGDYSVSTENLEKLRGICAEILANKGKAEELLPTQEGFFFGGTQYDQYYYDDLEMTVKMLDEALKNDNGEFYYHSSW